MIDDGGGVQLQLSLHSDGSFSDVELERRQTKSGTGANRALALILEVRTLLNAACMSLLCVQ